MRLHGPGIGLGQCCVVFLAVLCGAAPGAQQTLNGPLARPFGRFWNFQVTPDGGRVVFASEQDRYYWPEVYSAPVDGSSSSVKLSGELSGPDDEFHSFLLSPDGSRVVSVFEHRMMSAPTDGSAAPIGIAGLGCSTCDDAMFSYCFTADGAHVLYLDNEPGEYELYSVCSAPVDGSSPAVRLSEPDAAYSEYYGSPDGASVVIALWHLYGRPIDGSAPAVRLDPGLSFPYPWSAPAIAPDGTVVFRGRSGAIGLYAAPIDGSAAPVLLSGPLMPGGDVGAFALFPDGRGVVYSRGELFAAKLDGGAPPVPVSGPLVPGGNVGTFVVLPDSSRVVYAADALQDGRKELFIARLDTSVPPRRLSHTLDPGGNVGGFQITADGTRAVYDALEDGVTRLFSVPTDGGWPAQRLSSRLVAGGDVLSYRIAPDSRWVVYRADQRVDEQVELFSVPIDGSMRPHLRKVGEPPVRRLNVPLSATSPGVFWYAFAPDADRVLYSAEAEGLGYGAIYSVPLRGGPSVRLSEETGPGGSCSFPAPAQTSIPGLRTAFVFQKDYTTDSALLSVPFEGGTPLRLNPPLALGPPEGKVHAYRSSPDGRTTVYFADEEHRGVFELYSVPTEGGVPAVKLNGPLPYGGDVSGSGSEWSTPAAEGTFEITPDGSRVVYTADQDVNDEVELYVAPIDGLAPALRLGSGSDVLQGLARDPSSERVVFRLRDAQDVVRLFSQRLDGSEAPLALTGALVAGGNVVDFALAPDGTSVVFRADAELDTRYELYCVPIDGSAPRWRVSLELGSDGDVSAFAITPDASRVLFLANPRLSAQFELYSTELLSGLPLELDPELVGTGSVRRFLSSPDGRWAVFTASPSAGPRQLYAVPCDGSALPQRLNGQLTAGGNVHDSTFLVSPDSQRVVYLADQEIDGTVELYSTAIDGDSPVRKLSGPLGGADYKPLRISPDSRRVFYVGYSPPSGGLFVVGISGVAPPLRLSPLLASGTDVASFDLDSVGLHVLYRLDTGGLFYAPTDAARPARRVDLPPGSVNRATFTADPRFALYLQSHWHGYYGPSSAETIELNSFRLPTRLRHGEPPEPF